MAVTVEELVVTLSARMDQYTLALQSAQRDGDRRFAAIEQRFDTFAARLKSGVSGVAASLRNTMAGVAAGFGVTELLGYADAWTRVTRALESSEQVFGITLASGERVAQMAIETRSNLEEVSKLYIRTAAAAAKLGIDTAVAADVTTTFAKALKLGQATTAEQTSAIGQFSQALQKGKLDGDEFRTIMESAGVVQQALIEKFRVSGATLIKMAADGKIGARDIIEALQQVKPQIDEAFGRSAATVSEAWENLRTAVTVTLGKWNEAQGVTRSLADAIQGIANNLDNLLKGLVVVGTVLGVAFSDAIIGALARVAAGFAAVATGGGLLAAAMIGLVAAAGSVRMFGDAWDVVAEKGVTARDVLLALGAEGKDAVAAAFEVAGNAVLAFADEVLDFLTARGPSGARSFSVSVRTALNGIIGAFDATGKIIAASLLTVFGAVPEQVTALLNAGLGHLEGFVRSAASALNNLPGVNIDVDAIAIARIPALFAGATANVEALWASAARSMGRDYIAEMGAAVDTVSAHVLQRAGEIADRRRWFAGTTVKRATDPKPVYSDPAAGAKKYEDAVEKMREHTAALIADAAAVGKSAAERERAAAMHDLVTAARKAEIAITPQLLAQMDELARAYGAARGQLEFLQSLQRTRDDDSAARDELRLVGLYGYELHRARVEMELLNGAKRAGVVLTDAMRAEIAQTAAASAATQQLSDSLAAVRDTSRSALSGFISDLREGRSGAEALSNSLGRIADKLVDMAAGQLVEGALGALFGNKSAGGAGLLSVFGFAEGGVMTHAGPRALNRFAAGGVSRTAAIFGEAGPEAAVPLPDGRRIPVELRLPDISAAARQVSSTPAGPPVAVTVAPVFHVGGKVTADDLVSLEKRVAQALPGMAVSAVAQAMERQPGFGRKGA